MNVFNRVVMIVLILAAIAAVTLVCVLPDASIVALDGLASSLQDIRDRIELGDRIFLVGIAVIVDLALIILLVLELSKPRIKTVPVQSVDGGKAVVTMDSIEKRLAFYIDGLADVASVQPKARLKKDGINVAVDVQTSAAVNVPDKAAEIIEVINQVVCDSMGLKLLGDTKVNIRTGNFNDVDLSGRMAIPSSTIVAPPEPVETVEESKPKDPLSNWVMDKEKIEMDEIESAEDDVEPTDSSV